MPLKNQMQVRCFGSGY